MLEGLKQEIIEVTDRLERIMDMPKTQDYSEFLIKNISNYISNIKENIDSICNNIVKVNLDDDSKERIEEVEYSILNMLKVSIVEYIIRIEKIESEDGESDFRMCSNILADIDGILSKLKLDIDRVIVLNKLYSEDKQVSIIVGANGSGKSSLADFFKDAYLSNTVVIPAQKYLNFKLDYIDVNFKTWFEERTYGRSKINTEDLYRSEMYIQEYFSKNIIILIKNHINALHKNDRDKGRNEKSAFKELCRIWDMLIPDIELDLCESTNRLVAIKNDEIYDMNSLSEGEKALILYISSVLLVEENTILIIDEPETFLNQAISNKLWDILLEERKDCKFIFISHTIDFVISRNDAKLVWCKDFIHPDEWIIEDIKEDTSLPENLLVEIMGSRKKILFCEGEDKSSFDYRVYSKLFIDDYTVYPVGGHKQVINNKKAYDSLGSQFNQEAIGIIDGDNHTDEIIKGYKEDEIYVLPFNEIEMLLLSEEVIRRTLEANMDEAEVEDRIVKFKDEAFDLISKKKENIICSTIKQDIDERFYGEGIENYKDKKNIKSSLETICNIDIDKLYNEYERKIDKIIEEKNYSDLLKICNLKGALSIGLANRELDSDYIEKAIVRISREEKLRRYLRDTYFSDIKNNEE